MIRGAETRTLSDSRVPAKTSLVHAMRPRVARTSVHDTAVHQRSGPD
jgi:hypothetical protein